jgi:hypothetical protein
MITIAYLLYMYKTDQKDDGKILPMIIADLMITSFFIVGLFDLLESALI